MAARNGLQRLARTIALSKEALPVRGGGGGPVKLADAPNKPLPLWNELWYNDGQFHSQPALDYTAGEKPFWPASKAALALATAFGVMGGFYYTVFAGWKPSKASWVPMQYPPEVLETYGTTKSK